MPFITLQKSAGTAREEIKEFGTIDQLCYKKRADNAEAAAETR
jgi:hypothetical protein